MSAEILLSRLDKVRQTGAGKWMALCPAHDDKSPSLSVRELADEIILLHCFSGCDVHDVVVAVGLSLSDLFPQKNLGHNARREKHPFPALDILRAISFELMIVSLATTSLLAGEPLNALDRARLELAIERIKSAIHAGGIQHG
jgi:CHC2 zinc finger